MALIKCGKCKRISKYKIVNNLFVCKHCGSKNNITNTHYHNKDSLCPHYKESVDNFKTLKEWLGFNYREYQAYILKAIGASNFEDLRANNSAQLEAGKFTDVQINKLKGVLKDGFKDEQSLKQIALNINKKVKPKDLYKIKDGQMVLKDGEPILQMSAGKRGITIARTESTRVANAGAINYYNANGITKYQWVASLSDRTCPICEDLNGLIIGVGTGLQPPAHVYCRCTTVGIRDLK